MSERSIRDFVDVLLDLVLDEDEIADVNYNEDDFSLNIIIKLPKVPAGRLIGRGGAMATATRTILSRIASGQGKQCVYKVIGEDSD